MRQERENDRTMEDSLYIGCIQGNALKGIKIQKIINVSGKIMQRGAKMNKLHEECGVFGVYGKGKAAVAATAYYGLFALQHRGQESCEIGRAHV